ncbi:M48 family metalloprotease [Aquibacillus rhizosphaerae]|uniref:M48 family metalloprotease n=1 Tax=Aquibacillus rhizosphaerae TaxID=3051431 RepID=A0ABT7L2V1_9BACI|nr:M48 family metalloprotease [Aquibacillus sp. LR5S19]MDL4838915.1 M48 family metalloprotease [Aquibacillus sp. LR5S19]
MSNNNLIFIILVIFLINLGTAAMLRMYTLKKHNRGLSVEKSLYRFHKLKYGHYIFTVISSAIISFIAIKVGEISIYFLATIPFVYVVVVLITTQAFYHKVYQAIRKTETSLMEDILFFMKMLIVMMIPSILIIVLRTYYITNMESNEFVLYTLLVLVIVLLLITYPYLMHFSLRAKQIESEEKKKAIVAFINKQNIRNVKVYQFSSKRSKFANAMIIGVFTKRIFISDYLLENLSTEETCSILAHELGHLKKKHLLIKAILLFFAIPLFTGIGYILDEMEALFGFKIPIPVGVIGMLGSLIAYLGFIFLKLSKIQEYQADKYALDIGVDKDVYLAALIKVTELNDSVKSVNNLDELLGTHPSLENRINRIEEAKEL